MISRLFSLSFLFFLTTTIFPFYVKADDSVSTAELCRGLSCGRTPFDLFVYGMIFLLLSALLMLFNVLRRMLAFSGFSLSDAVSEEVEITAFKDGEPILNADGSPLEVTVMRASVSRLIALSGGMVVLLVYIGFATFSLWHFAHKGSIPVGAKDISSFLLSGLALFAPYTVNKFSGLFDGMIHKVGRGIPTKGTHAIVPRQYSAGGVMPDMQGGIYGYVGAKHMHSGAAGGEGVPSKGYVATDRRDAVG